MDSRPFTFAEAEEILEDFEDLIDTEFTWDESMVIVDGLLVCPYGTEEKDAFFDEYSNGNDLSAVMEAYTGSDFDVIIAVCDSADDTRVSYISISEYIEEKGITYNLPSA